MPDRIVNFNVLELEDINVAYTEGVLKVITLIDKPSMSVVQYIERLARTALEQFPLKFPKTDNPLVTGREKDNIFRAPVQDYNLVFTAAHYEGKNCVFAFIWEELQEHEVPDGQNRRGKK